MAIAHKMLRIIHAMLLDSRPYQDSEVAYEELQVQRNAPRWVRKLKQCGFLDQPAAPAVTVA